MSPAKQREAGNPWLPSGATGSFLAQTSITIVCWLALARFIAGAEPTRDAVSQAAARAEEQLRAAHFFTGGRGLHTAPNLQTTYSLLRDLPGKPFDVIRAQAGFIREGDDPVGFFWTEWRGVTVGTVGCAACHMGRAAGRTYAGLGNKSIDVAEVGSMVMLGTQITGNFGDSERRRLNEKAATFGRLLADKRWTNSTRGMVPTSIIFRWFYDESGVPFPDDFPRGCAKVSHLWGYGEKREVGLFVDGFADGESLGWAALVELASGQSYAGFESYRDRLRALKEEFANLLPPAYPFAVDRELADRGQAVFARNCAECHGEYRRDAAGRPIFAAPEFVLLAEIGTDDDRLKYRSQAWLKLVAAGPWRDDFRHHDREPGYFAPRLEGIWARFPYLHNGSVPSLAALLTPAPQRPRFWSLDEAGEAHRFDAATVGLNLPPAGTADASELQRRGQDGSRAVYSVDRPGHSNQGHEFGTELPADEKAALIEYLKTL